MKTAFVLLAMLALASAACPNQCSGHGRCSDNDKCVCYQQSNTPWGQRNGWTGADCSLRTCPLGTAFDAISNKDDSLSTIRFIGDASATGPAATNQLNVDLNHDYNLDRDETIQVRVSSVGSGSVFADGTLETFQWRFKGDDFFQQAVPYTDGGGSTRGVRENAYELKDHHNNYARSGVVVWFNPIATARVSTAEGVGSIWEFDVKHNNRVSWRRSNDNTMHQMEECSGRGACNQATGRCECFAGHSGEACQRTTCPNDCSGHGVCQEERRFVADANADGSGNDVTYAAASTTAEAQGLGPYDARKQMGCLCDDGFRGPDCSMIECPSGADPLRLDATVATEGRDCSGRGVCNYGTGQCSCFKGYFGERCEEQTNFI